MKETNGASAARAEHPATPSVAPRFTRAAGAERLRLEGKREQLRHKREEVQAELERIDGDVDAIGELLELLAPLLAANGSGSEGVSGEDGGAEAELGASPPERSEPDGRDRAQR